VTEEEQTLADIRAEVAKMGADDQAVIMDLVVQIVKVMDGHPLSAWALALVGAELAARR
jgi:hypothetical protein